MNDTISTVRGVLAGREQELVSARDLYRELKVGRAFSHWATERIEQFGLVVDQDYVKVPNGPHTGTIRQSWNYLLTPLAALRWTMHARSFRGVLSPKKNDLLKQVGFFRERFIQQNPAYEKVMRYAAMSELNDDERAALMGWTLDQWQEAITDLGIGGFLVPSETARSG